MPFKALPRGQANCTKLLYASHGFMHGSDISQLHNKTLHQAYREASKSI